MFEKSASNRPKLEVSVTLSLSDNEVFDARVFLRNDERLIDLLNDDRGFIPVRREDGATIIIAKSNIVSVVERVAKAAEDEEEQNAGTGNENGPEEASAKKLFDPYKTLRVSPDASLGDIRRAYKARIKAVHPDTLAGLDLDDEISKAAKTATQRVNYAYQKIVRERREAERAETDASSDECADAGKNANAA